MRTTALSFDALGDVVAHLPGGRLAPVRTAALAALREHGLPGPRDEDWKYTDIASLVDLSNAWLQGGARVSATAGLESLIRQVTDSIDADWIVFANGEVTLPGGCPAELSLLSGSDIDLESPTGLLQLNAALLLDGAHVRVRKDQRLDRPIGLLVVDEAADSDHVTQSRVHLDFETGSRGSVIEYHASLGTGRQFANSAVRLRTGRDAEVRYVRLQNRARHHSQTGRLDVDARRDSVFRHSAFDFGGALVRNDLAISIAEPGADVSFDGLYLAGEGQHIDNHTRVDHRVGPACSRQEYRGILAGDARCIWNGKAIVHDGADGTDAAQANHNLLLSPGSEVDAKPELEIYADDVKCSHGTTVGQLDEAALYYLRTRGLDRPLAQRVLTRAFARAIVERTPVDALGDTLAELLDARLAGLLGESPQ